MLVSLWPLGLVLASGDLDPWRLSSYRSLSPVTTLPLPSCSDAEDSYLWEIEGQQSFVFPNHLNVELNLKKSNSGWEIFGLKDQYLDMILISRLQNLNRLPTRQRLSLWGTNTSSSWGLCDTEPETRDHIMLACEISEAIWHMAIGRLGYRPFPFQTWTCFYALACAQGLHLSKNS